MYEFLNRYVLHRADQIVNCKRFVPKMKIIVQKIEEANTLPLNVCRPFGRLVFFSYICRHEKENTVYRLHPSDRLLHGNAGTLQ
jgi:hypothetical protein